MIGISRLHHAAAGRCPICRAAAAAAAHTGQVDTLRGIFQELDRGKTNELSIEEMRDEPHGCVKSVECLTSGGSWAQQRRP